MKKIILVLLISISFIPKVNASTSSATENILMNQTTGRVLVPKKSKRLYLETKI